MTNQVFTDYSHSYNPFIYNLIPEKSVCLDVGCSAGSLGSRLIKSKNCIVDGVDFNAGALVAAVKVGYRNSCCVDMNVDISPIQNLSDYSYDVIIFSDVLEHLTDPQKILLAFLPKLKKGGVVVASLPNVAFLLNRINLLLGNWEYKKYGILDQTHLRFYTMKTARKLFEQAGMVDIHVYPYNQFGILKYLHPIDKIFGTLLAYQFAIVCKSKI